MKTTLLLKDIIGYLVKECGFFLWYGGSDSIYYFENSDDFYEFPQRPEVDNAKVLYIGTRENKICVLLDKF